MGVHSSSKPPKQRHEPTHLQYIRRIPYSLIGAFSLADRTEELVPAFLEGSSPSKAPSSRLSKFVCLVHSPRERREQHLHSFHPAACTEHQPLPPSTHCTLQGSGESSLPRHLLPLSPPPASVCCFSGPPLVPPRRRPLVLLPLAPVTPAPPPPYSLLAPPMRHNH